MVKRVRRERREESSLYTLIRSKLPSREREREHFGANGDIIGSLCLHQKWETA
jgi:hypothetical protein